MPFRSSRPRFAVQPKLLAPIISEQARSTIRQTRAALAFSEATTRLALGYFAALFAAEFITVYVDTVLGLLFHAVLLSALILHGSRLSEQPIHLLLLSLTLAPIIRILSLAMPLNQFDRMNWYVVVGIPLLVSAWTSLRALGFSRKDVGLTLPKIHKHRYLPKGKPWANFRNLLWVAYPFWLQFLISCTGLFIGYLEYRILKPDPLVVYSHWQELIYPALVLLIFTGFVEEFIFRGIMQRAALLVLGRFGLFYVALIFALLHIGYHSLVDVVFVFAIGVLWGWLAKTSRSIVGITLAHGLTNITLFLIFPAVITG